MRDLAELLTLHEQGIHAFGEAVTCIVCEAAERDPVDMARELPERFLAGVEESACSLPQTATADDCVVFKSSRAHAEQWFQGAVGWRRYFAGHPSHPVA